MKRLHYIFLLAGTVLATSGCNKNFLSSAVNNPNQPSPSSATPSLILPGTMTGITNITNSPSYYQEEATWMGYWNYSGGYSFNYDVAVYTMTTGTPSPIWDAFYENLGNLNVIMQDVKGNASEIYFQGAANVLEAICFQQLVDVYGDIPYSKALQGSGDFYPTYDAQSVVYDGIVAQCDSAIAEFQAGQASSNTVQFGSEDILFGGDMTKWIQFANTVKLKILLRESGVSAKASYIASEISKTESLGYLTSDALVNPGFSASQASPMWGSFGLSAAGALNGDYNYIRAGGFAMQFYKNTSDPRLGFFYSGIGQAPNSSAYFNVTLPLDTNNYYADLFGIQITQPSKGSGIGPGLIQTANQSAVLMSASESYFTQAEAAARGLITGNAQTLYQDGITASFEYLGVPNADSNAYYYYSQSGVTNVSWPATEAAQVQAIITQKWAALNGIAPIEAWDDWRRTGFPVVPLSAYNGNTETHMPYRYYYPIEEPNNNNAAWTAAGGATIDPFNTKIFWMP